MISALTGEVVSRGETFDTFGRVYTDETVDAFTLAHKMQKQITAKVNDRYVGWTCVISFTRFKARRENIDKISEITFWAFRSDQEFCRYHIMLLLACGYDEAELYPSNYTKEENDKYYRHLWQEEIVQSNKQEVEFKLIR